MSLTKDREDKEKQKREDSVKERLGVTNLDSKDKNDNTLEDTSARRRALDDKKEVSTFIIHVIAFNLNCTDVLL